jgi:hypothetical protein
VPPGESASAYLSARPRQPRLAGGTRAHRFSVEHRQDLGATGRVPLRFEQRPVLGAVATAAVAGIALAATAFAGVLLWPAVRDVGSGGEAPGASAAATPTTGSGPDEPVRRFYVVWHLVSADDLAQAGTLEAMAAQLAAAGVETRIVSSLDSDQLQEPPGGEFLVLVQDDFPDIDAARSACEARRDIAPACNAVAPRQS